MGKLILIALVGLGAALYFPDTRASIMEQVVPAVEPALAPIRLRQTKGRLKTIAKDLTGYGRLYDKLPPDQEGFQRWLFGQYAAPSSYEDSWQQSFQYTLGGGEGFLVRSAGPDLTFGTEDDLTSTGKAPLASRRR